MLTKKSLAAMEASIRARMDADMKEILDQLVKVAKAVKKMQVSEAPQKSHPNQCCNQLRLFNN